MTGGAAVFGLGHYAPARRVTNAEIEQRLGVEPGWIFKRTGIEERRFAVDGEKLSDMAVAAGEMALLASGIARAEVGMVLLATSTPDHLLPPSAPLVAHRLGLSKAGGIDLAGACAGFLYALSLADAYVKTRGVTVLVIAANILSRRINPEEAASSVLFADAAGAVLLGPCKDANRGVLACELTAEGGGYDLIKIPAGGSAQPFTPGLAPSDLLMTLSDGKAVFVEAVRMMAHSSRRALASLAMTGGDVSVFVPHQANVRIVEAVRRDLGIAQEAVGMTLSQFGNSSAATIPFTLSRLTKGRDFQPGERVLVCAAGAGMNGGAIVLGM